MPVHAKSLKLIPKSRKVAQYVYTVTNHQEQLHYVFGTKADAQKYVGAVCLAHSIPADAFRISKRTICG